MVLTYLSVQPSLSQAGQMFQMLQWYSITVLFVNSLSIKYEFHQLSPTKASELFNDC